MMEHSPEKQRNSTPAISFMRLPAILNELSVSRPTFYRWIKQGRAPCPIRVGPRLSLWRRDDIEGLKNDLIENSGKREIIRAIAEQGKAK